MNTRWMKSLLHLLRRIERGAGEEEVRQGMRRFLEEEYGVRVRFLPVQEAHTDQQRPTELGVLEVLDPLGQEGWEGVEVFLE
ncbi:MAG: hypothetical protein L3J76_00875, partial [Candidatus Hydrothermae bacterium]|nr:hypothetical protein [Candidatus Hydrothermae bacterium]